MMTLDQMQQCEQVAAVIISYRATHNFLTSPCWMDEWALGYLCALRDTGIINIIQWGFLCGVFQPDSKPMPNRETLQ